MKGFGGPEVVLGCISSVKRGCTSVTVGDTKNFIEIEIAEREISMLKCALGFALGPHFEYFLGGPEIVLV